MRGLLLLVFFGVFIHKANCQGSDFVYHSQYTNETELSRTSDSLNGPVLVYGGKIYAIGSLCVSRLIDGSLNDRDRDGKSNRRKRKGGKNSRDNGGDENDRDRNGDSDDRNGGGAVGYRKKKGGKNGRNKGGNENERNADGNSDDRDNDGDADSRDADGNISRQPHCSTAKNGKILLYTLKQISSKDATLYYKGKHFSNKYFKIIQL